MALRRYLRRPLPEVLALFERLFTRVLKHVVRAASMGQVSLYREHTPLRLCPQACGARMDVLGRLLYAALTEAQALFGLFICRSLRQLEGTPRE